MAENQPDHLLDYSVYLLDARGRIRRVERWRAASDECAVSMLSNLDHNNAAELWRRGRRIAVVGCAKAQWDGLAQQADTTGRLTR